MMQKSNMQSTHQFIQQQNQQLPHHHQHHHFQHQQLQQHDQQHQNLMQGGNFQQEHLNHGSGILTTAEQQHRPSTSLPPTQPSVAGTHCPVGYPPPHPQFHPPPRPLFQPYFSQHQQFVVNANISIQSQQNDPKPVSNIAIGCGGSENNKVVDSLSLAIIPLVSNTTININNNIDCINKTEYTMCSVVVKNDDTTAAPASDVDSYVGINDTINRNDLRPKNKSTNSPRRRHHRCHHNLSNSSSNSSNTVVPKGAESSEVARNEVGSDIVSNVKSVKARRESCSSSPLLQSLIDSQFTLVAAKANTNTDTSTGGKRDVGTVKRGCGTSSGKGGQVNVEGKVVPVSGSQQKQHHKSKHKDERRKQSSSSSVSISESLPAESVGAKEIKCPISEQHKQHSSHLQHQTPTHNHQTEHNKQLKHTMRESEPPTQQQNQHTLHSQQEQQYHHQDSGSSHPPVDPGILYYHPGQSPAIVSGPSYPHGFPQQGFLNSAQQHFSMINPSGEYQPSPHFSNHQTGGPQSLHQVHQNLHHQHQMQQQFNMALYHQQQGLHPFPQHMLPGNITNHHQSEAPSSCHVAQLPPQALSLLHPPYHHPHPQHLHGGGFQHSPPYPGFHQNALPGYFINAGNNSGNPPSMNVNNMGPYVPGLNSHPSQYPQSSFPCLQQQSFSGERRVGHETPLNLPLSCLMPGRHPSTAGYPMPSESANVNRSVVSPASCLNDLPVHLSNLVIENKQQGNSSNDNDDTSVAGSSAGSRRHHRRNRHRRSPASSLASESSRVLQENVTAESVKSGSASNRLSSDTSRTEGSATHHHNLYRSSGKENVQCVGPDGLFINTNIRHHAPCSDSASCVRDDNTDITINKIDGINNSNRVDRRNLNGGKSTKQRINAPSNYSESALNNINCDGGDNGRASFLSDQQQHQMNQQQQRGGGGGMVFRNINSICAITPPQSPYRGDCGGDSSGVDVLHSGEETASNVTVSSSSSSTVRRQHHKHDKQHNANSYHSHPRRHNQQPPEEMAMNEAMASSAPNMSSFDSAISYSNSPVSGSPSIGSTGVGSGYHGTYSWDHDGTCDTRGQEDSRNDHSYRGPRNDQSHGGPRHDPSHGLIRNEYTNGGSRNDRSHVGPLNDNGHGGYQNTPFDHPPSSRHHRNHQPSGGDGSQLPDAGLVALGGDGRMFRDEQHRDASFPPLPLARCRNHHNGAAVESLDTRNNDSKSRGIKSGSRSADTFKAAAVTGSTAVSSCTSYKDESSSEIQTKSSLRSTPLADTTIKTSTLSKRNQIKKNKNYLNTSMDDNNNSVFTGLIEPHHHHHHDIKEEEEEEEEAPALSNATTTSSLHINPSETNDGDDSVVARRKCQAVKRSNNRGEQYLDGYVGGDVFSSNVSDVFRAHEQSQQMGTVAVGVAARRMVQPLPQLVLARQRLSSRELPDVLTPDTPQFPCAYTKFKLNLK